MSHRILALVAAPLLFLGANMPHRSPKAALDARHHRQASVVTGTYLHPVGPGHASVLLDGSETPVTVPVAVGPKTWAPGARVTIARPDDATPRHAIIGGPTGGQQGGSALSVRRIPPGPPPADSYYGYVYPGGVVEAWQYADGDPVELLGVLDASTPGAVAALGTGIDNAYGPPILTDPTGRVAPSSIAFGGTRVPFVADGTPYGPQIAVWDPVAAKVYHVVVDGLSEEDYCFGPAVHAGRVYWITSLHNSVDPSLSFTTATLYVADADLAHVSTAGTVAVSPGSDGTVQGYQIVSPTAMEVGLGRSMIRAEFAGGGSSLDNLGVGHPDAIAAGGGSLGVLPVGWNPLLTGDPGTVGWRPDALAATFVARFANAGPWSYRRLHSPGSPIQASADGSVGAAFVERTDPADTALTIPTLLIFNAASPGPAPLKAFAVQPTPAGYFPFFIVPAY